MPHFSSRGSILVGSLIIVLVLGMLSAASFWQVRREESAFVRQEILQERMRLQQLLLESVDCAETFARATINPASPLGSCSSTSEQGGQSGPYFSLRTKPIGGAPGAVFGTGAQRGDGSFQLGSFFVRASCSEAERSLVVRARPINQATEDWNAPFNLLIGKSTAGLPGKRAIETLPLCQGFFPNAMCRVVRYQTHSGSYTYALKPATLPSNAVWTDRNLFSTTVDPLEISNANLLVVGDFDGAGIGHAGLYRTPSATELADIKARFESGLHILFFADNGITPAPYWGDANRGSREILAGVTNKMVIRGTWAGDYDYSGSRTADIVRYPFLAGVTYLFGGTGFYTPSDIYNVTAPAECVIQSGTKCRVAFLPKEASSTHGEILISGNANVGSQRTISNFMKRVCPPPPVVLSDVTKIVTVARTSCLIRSGGVKCAGKNGDWQFGMAAPSFSNTPLQVVGFETGVTDITMGREHACAIKNGEVYCFGRDRFGGLGGGGDSPTPILVPGLPRGGATRVAAGRGVSCAIISGALYCWGNNSDGQLGRGTVSASGTAALVPGMDNGVTEVSISSEASEGVVCAIRNGAAYCWGKNLKGQTGSGSTSNALTSPTLVSGMGAGVTEISAGEEHVCAIRDGNAFCWGYNAFGNLGNGSTAGSNVPVAVVGLTSPVRSIAAGGTRGMTCATDSAYGLNCWGRMPSSLLMGGIRESRVPVPVVGATEGVTLVGLAEEHLFFVKGNSIWAAGKNDEGVLGTGSRRDLIAPEATLY